MARSYHTQGITGKVHIATESNERERLKRRGWRRMHTALIEPAIYRQLLWLDPGTYELNRIGDFVPIRDASREEIV